MVLTMLFEQTSSSETVVFNVDRGGEVVYQEHVYGNSRKVHDRVVYRLKREGEFWKDELE